MIISLPAVIVSSYLVLFFVRSLLHVLNLRHLRRHGTEVPSGFEGRVDEAAMARTTAYTVEQSRLGLVESICETFLLLVFVFSGILGRYDSLIASLTDSFVGSGVIFFLGLTLLQAVIDIPFSLFLTFRVENRFGFNTMSPRLWLADFFKTTTIATLLVTIMTAGAFFIVQNFPHYWWLLVWLFFGVVSLFLMYLSPYIIEPLFFTFEPIREAGLEEEIRALMTKAGLQVGKVQQMDASQRSRHSNAYFTGIGRVKRIVLYDTLLAQMDHQEVLAVLAHEVGHWRKGHIWKRLVMTELGAFVGCYLVYRLIAWGGLPTMFGFEGASFAAQLVLLGFLSSFPGFLITPVGSWFSRRQEWQADEFAIELTATPGSLSSALVKLATENLANLHPHPLYAKFYYTHPPVVERVGRLVVAADPDHNGFRTGAAGAH